MRVENLKNVDHDKIKDNLKLKEEKIEKNEAHLVYSPIKKDEEFEIGIDVDLKQNPSGLKADSKLILYNSLGKKIREFLLKNEIILGISQLKDYLEDISDMFEKWRKRNLGSPFSREDFKRNWAKERRKKIISKVAKKL